MDGELMIEVAKNRDMTALGDLLRNAFLLSKRMASCDGESLLHAACMEGQVDFVREAVRSNPELVLELSQDGLTPLHIASSIGDLEIVRELLKLDTLYNLCSLKGKEMRIPLHCAVAKGRIPVVKELLFLPGREDSIGEVTVRGETCFHLAVKNNQFEVFMVLADHVLALGKQDILNKMDRRGNTILHLAASRKQFEFVDILLDKNFGYGDSLEINKLNKLGFTPLDVLISQGGDSDIHEMLTLSGALRVEQMQYTSPVVIVPSPRQSLQLNRPKSASQKLRDYFKHDGTREPPSKVRNMLLVISVLIATASYQAVLSPPGGVWQDNYTAESRNNTRGGEKSHRAGKAVMGTQNVVSYGLFLLFNSVGFFMSLHMMNFLTLGLPLHFELQVALLALVATYDTCMFAISPDGVITVCFVVLSFVTPIAMVVLSRVVRDYKLGHRGAVTPMT